MIWIEKRQGALTDAAVLGHKHAVSIRATMVHALEGIA
jgi:hypothetical protein